MADPEQDKPTAKELKEEELMEVVTLYKCRVCDFATSSRADMSTHLQKTHINSRVEPQPSESPVAQSDSKPANPVLSDSECAVLPDLSGPCNVSESIDSGTGNVTTTTARTYEAPVFFSNLGLTSNQASGSPRNLVSPALPDPKVLTSQMRSVAKNLPIIPSCQSDIQLLSLNSSSAGRQSLPITSLQLTGSGLTFVSTTLDSVSVPFMENPKDLGTGPTSIAPITKELFLCGVCSMGFSSVDECNSHMEREHHVQVEGVSVSDMVVDKLEQRVSVGTQATGKRPGRKRKSEMPPPSSPPARKAKEWTDHVDDDENDEDWIPGRSLSSQARDGRQRRKIRAPKALKEDYVTEKKRTYRKRQMMMKESFHLECSYMGCPTKFRSQESLDIHHRCHNKEDDAFTCIHCQEPFQFWKALRIHLFRSHKIDCDMFQCDVCEYKTDTLHKLGIHREIHSEHRPYTCDVCGKGFKQLSQMKNHQIIHAEHQRTGRERWFSNKTCEVCKRTFANSKCLKKHVEAVHGQNKPFKCQFCNHTTAWKAMLVLHERTHTGEKPFKCDVCPYATGDHNSLRRHKMRHTGQRQYKCQLCSYTCIQTISLKTHMRNKHPHAEGVVYTCQLCKFRTINKQIFDNHLEDHRNGLVPVEKLDTNVSSQAPPMTLTIDSAGNNMTVMQPEDPVQFQLQVKKTETGELHANKEDIDKLNAIPQLVHSGVDANQLIYTALNIGSHIDGLSYTVQLANGVQSTVLPSLQPAKGILSSYSITFQASQAQASQPPASQPVIVDFRSLTEEVESATEAVSVSSDPSSQGAEPEDEVGMVLSEVSQGSSMEQVDNTLYAQVPQGIETTNKVSEGTFQASGFEVLQVASKGSSSQEGRGEVPVTDTLGAPALVVSQAGMENVLHNFIVVEGNQVVRTLSDREATIEGAEVVGRIVEGQEVVQLVEGERKGSEG
ncbi:uncharacterized protein LOC143300285 [Babylonia areolata]|uniref:uncharacterized protein LOC143300285 n=1 Tax=Babylonia areolata TaxID=304850 RepID=UPI003FD5FB20